MKYSLLISIFFTSFIFSSCTNENKRATAKEKTTLENSKIQSTKKATSTNDLVRKNLNLSDLQLIKPKTQAVILDQDLLIDLQPIQAQQLNQGLPIEDVLRPYEKVATKMSISANKKQVLTFPEGTKLTIPASAFKLKENGLVVSGKVEISVKEFYSKNDFLLENLNTMSDNQLLESGGTIHIEATYQGQECVLQNNKTIEISFPTQKKKEGMEIFYAANKGSDMNWVRATNPRSAVSAVISNSYATNYYVEQMPEFPGGEDSMTNFLKTNVVYPKYARDNNIEGEAIVEFIISTTGKVIDVTVSRSPDKSISEEAIRVVNSMPNFSPAIQNDTAIEVTYTLPICFSLNGNCYEKVKRSSPFQSNWQTSSNRKTVSTNHSKQVKRKFKTSKKIEDLSSTDIMNYALVSSKLGWINCDRFYNNKSPKINLAINIATNENVMMRLVFKSIKSIMSGSHSNRKYTFSNIPTNEKVTLFSLKKENGSYYIATQELVTGSTTQPSLSYSKIDKERLDIEVKKLSL